MSEFQVAIIGAGTAGLTARKEVAKYTDNYVIIDDGPLGTTCARVGCMPSKVLIQVAHDFDRKKHYEDIGIQGGKHLAIDTRQVMKHVRSLRDRFVRGVTSSMKKWEDKLIRKRATFKDAHTLDLNGETIQAKSIIVATGSRPIIPEDWAKYRDFLVDTNEFFELEDLPKTMAVIGLGVIGIELGQALSKLGVNVIAVTRRKQIAGVTDPDLNEYILKSFNDSMSLHFGGADIEGVAENGRLKIKTENGIFEVDKVLMAAGRRPNIDQLKIENTGIKLDERGMPKISPHTMQVEDYRHILIPGDVNGDRPILHEASDEGYIAGVNAINPGQSFQRRVPLGITFSSPNIAFAGKRYGELVDEKIDFVVGEVSFEGQGRSIVKLEEKGMLRVYAEKSTGKILGSELFGPDGEHLAHLIAWSINMKLTVPEALSMPFYHPVIEEGLRTALRDAAKKLGIERVQEVLHCDDPPIR